MINRLLSRFHWHRIWPRRRANPYANYLRDLRAYRDSHSAKIQELEAELAALRSLVRERQP